MKKPWLEENKGKTLEAYIGAYGIRTSEFETVQDLVNAACLLYDLEPKSQSVEQMSNEIGAIPKKERSRRAHANKSKFNVEDKRPTGLGELRVTHEGLEKMMAESKPHLVDGAPFDCEGDLDIDPARLLRLVVTAVINHGQAHILYDFPEVGVFFGSRIPDREEVKHLHNVDERMFEAKDRWPNRKNRS